MNKLLYFILALIIFAPLTSCDDFLDQKSPDKLTSDNYWRNQSDALSGLASAYSQLESFTGWDEWQEGRPVIEYYRNDMIKPGADAFNYTWWTDLFNFSYTPGNYALNLVWKTNYRGINFCNQVIENTPNIPAGEIDQDVSNEIIAEARYLRAYYYFKILSHYKKVIIRDKTPQDHTNLIKADSPRTEVYDFIIADLKAAALVLAKQRSANDIGRATKGAANAYLGKVYLYRAAEENNSTYLTEAKKALNEVIQSDNYSLEDNFLSMFDGTNENSNESVFELQLSSIKDGGAKYDMWFQYFMGATEFGFWEEILGTNALVSEMKKEGKINTDGNHDSRLYETCLFRDDYFNDSANPNVYGKTYDQWFNVSTTKINFRKYIPASADNFSDRSAINMPLMRYADVLLMYAEIVNEIDGASGTTSAINLINQIRAKHGDMPAMTGTSQAEVQAQIEHERIMEFTLEGSRFLDLRRWGKLENAMATANRSNFDGAEHYYLPVPEEETNTNSLITNN